MNQPVRYLRMVDVSRKRFALCTSGGGPFKGACWGDVRVLVYGEEYGRDPRNWQLTKERERVAFQKP